MRFFLCVALLAMSACQQQAPANGDPRLVPVTEGNAPTVGELLKQGFLIVDSTEGSFARDDGAIVHTFEDVFLGKENGPDDKSHPEYACPGTDEDMDEWKCRSLTTKANNG